MAKKKEKEQQKKQKKLVQHLFRADRLAEKEREGWKKVKPIQADHIKMTSKGDLVLMEKYV